MKMLKRRLKKKKRKPKKVLVQLAEGIKHHPQNAELHYRISACLMSIGQKQEALSFLKKALKLNYDKHNELFDYLPDLKENTSITDLIEAYKK